MLIRKDFTKSRNWIFAVILDLFGYFCLKLFASVSKKGCYDRRSVRKILVIRTDGIGDAVISIPLFKSLKQLFPEADVSCLIRPGSKEIFDLITPVSSSIVSRSRWEDLNIAFKNSKQLFDLIISPRPDGYLFNHILALVMKGKRRTGYAIKGGGFLLTDIVRWAGVKTAMELASDCVLPFGVVSQGSDISLKPSQGEDKYIEELLLSNGIGKDDPFILINPYAGHPFIWKEEYWVELIKRITKEFNYKLVAAGEAKHCQDLEYIKLGASGNIVSLAGMTTLSQLVSLIKRSKLLITVDSGPRHIANAVGTPVIVLRHSADSNIIWGTYTKNEKLIYHNVPCSPCGRKYCPEGQRVCMTRITPEEVLEKFRKVLKLQK